MDRSDREVLSAGRAALGAKCTASASGARTALIGWARTALCPAMTKVIGYNILNGSDCIELKRIELNRVEEN